MTRIRVADWDHPVCASWVESIDVLARPTAESLVVVARSLGCLAFVHWAALLRRTIWGALLVAVPNRNGPKFPEQAKGFSNLPMLTFPYRSIIVSSEDDPYGSPEYAKSCADVWGSEFVSIGRAAHINSASKLGTWPQGMRLLESLRQ
jgi:predicted alpha/beta hydrolase family esterase